MPPTDSMSSMASERSETSAEKGSPLQHTSSSRAAWIREWIKMYPDRPAACSAKSMYRLADSRFNPFYICSQLMNLFQGLVLTN